MVELLNINCMEYMAGLPDKAFDIAIVDIEYGIGASKPTNKPNTVKQNNGSVLRVKSNKYAKKDWDFKMSDEYYLSELFRVSNKQIIFGGNYYGLSGGYLIWDKLNGETDQFGCEMAWLSFSKRTDIVYYKWSGMIQGVYCGKEIRKAIPQQGNKLLNEERIHPTQKPVKLYSWIINEYCNEGWKILDTHGGSMSSAIAAEKLGYDMVLCEIDKDYYEAGVARFKKETDLGLFSESGI